jgi:hypothetical protein
MTFVSVSSPSREEEKMMKEFVIVKLLRKRNGFEKGRIGKGSQV